MRAYAITASAVLLLTLTACGGSSGPSAKPGSEPDAGGKQSSAVDCETASQADWLDHCAEDGDGEAPADLKLGKAYAYKDGVKVTITQIERVTKFGEYDTAPGKGETPFRVYVEFDNGSKKPLDLDEWAVLAAGATNGGEAEPEFFTGSKEITGRVAPGVRVVKSDDWVMADEYGKRVLVTVSRADGDLFTQRPAWVGSIRG